MAEKYSVACIFSVSIHLMEICFHFLTIMNNVSVNIGMQYLFNLVFLCSSVNTPEVELLYHIVNILRNLHTIPQ